MSGKSRGQHRAHEEHEEHEEHVNHEAWVIPYADMLTLLMALFLVLFAVGRTDTEKFKKLAESFRNEFGTGDSAQVVDFGGTGETPVDGGNGVLENSGAAVPRAVPTPADVALAVQQQAYDEARVAADSLEAVEEQLVDQAEALGIAQEIEFDLDARGLVLTIVSDQILFEPGRAELQPEGLRLLDLVATTLTGVPNRIAIEGHTDSRPISTERFPSNWELSSSRATSVLRFMVDAHGFDPLRLAATGYADTRPIDDNGNDVGAARNRRVEIVVLSDVSLQPVLDAIPDDVVPDLLGEDVAADPVDGDAPQPTTQDLDGQVVAPAAVAADGPG